MWVKKCRVPINALTVSRTQLHTHACTHTSEYIIMYAQKVTLTSPNHALRYCHDYVCIVIYLHTDTREGVFQAQF